MSPNVHDDSQLWCEERLRHPTEDVHLARLFSTPAQRPVLTATGAIYIELEAIATGFRDLNIARTKLGWWREELARLDAGHPAHPATRLLAANESRILANPLMDLVTGAELILLAGAPNDLATARMRAERGFARLAAVLGARFGANDAVNYAPLGAAIGLARALLAPLAPEARATIAASARDELASARPTIGASPPALRVLAALAWRRTARPTLIEYTHGENRRRVFIAWRAAHGRLPRNFRTWNGA